MGMFYSMISYFYKPKIIENISATNIRISASKLQKYLNMKLIHLQKQSKKSQDQLIQLISVQVGRSIQGQKATMNDIILNGQLAAAYQDIIVCAKRISSEANQLQNDSSKISNQCFIAICSILYTYQPFKLMEIVQLNQLVPQPHPSISLNNTTPIIQSYFKKKTANFYDMNMYALEMSQRNNINLQLINQVGHQFVYNPQVELRQSKSSQMFALDILEIQSDYYNCQTSNYQPMNKNKNSDTDTNVYNQYKQ